MNTIPFVSEDLLKMNFIGTPHLSPLGDELLWVETTVLEQENTYTSVIMHSLGGDIAQLTRRGGQSKGKDYAPLFSPDGTRIAFMSDRGGKADIWMLSKGRGEAIRLTDCAKPVNSFVWDSTGKGIFFCNEGSNRTTTN